MRSAVSAASILQRHKLRLTQSGSFFGFFLRFFFLDWRLGPLTLALLGAPTSTRSAGPASADSRRISRVLQPVITAAIVGFLPTLAGAVGVRGGWSAPGCTQLSVQPGASTVGAAAASWDSPKLCCNAGRRLPGALNEFAECL